MSRVGIDPVLGAAAAKIGNEAASSVNSLMQRALGPAADVLGVYIADMTRRRLANSERIAQKTIDKAKRLGRSGSANPRVAKEVLGEGSYCDDELMAEYFSGLLAASWTSDGRDDRAVFWSKLVGGLSSPQVRLHYLLYREWAARLHGREDVRIGLDEGRNQAHAEIDLFEILSRMTPEGEPDFVVNQPDRGRSVLDHATVGLVREGVLGPTWGIGRKEALNRTDAAFQHILHVQPSSGGIELFGWAIGLQGLGATEFLGLGQVPALDPPIPRLESFTMRQLPGTSALAEGA